MQISYCGGAELAIARGFHNVAVKERDLARLQRENAEHLAWLLSNALETATSPGVVASIKKVARGAK